MPFLVNKDATLRFNEKQITYNAEESSVNIFISGSKVKTKRPENFNPQFGIKNCKVIEITSTGKFGV